MTKSVLEAFHPFVNRSTAFFTTTFFIGPSNSRHVHNRFALPNMSLVILALLIAFANVHVLSESRTVSATNKAQHTFCTCTSMLQLCGTWLNILLHLCNSASLFNMLYVINNTMIFLCNAVCNVVCLYVMAFAFAFALSFMLMACAYGFMLMAPVDACLLSLRSSPFSASDFPTAYPTQTVVFACL